MLVDLKYVDHQLIQLGKSLLIELEYLKKADEERKFSRDVRELSRESANSNKFVNT